MQSTDRPAFAKLFEALCAGFNLPATEARLEAYWRGLSSMHLLAFERVVDYALGPNGDDDMPTARQCYHLYRRLQSEARARESAAIAAKPAAAEFDIFTRYCNLLFFAYLRAKSLRVGSGASKESLDSMVACKNQFAQGYREMCVGEPQASLELRDALIDAWEKRFEPAVLDAQPPQLSRDEVWQHIAACVPRG